MKNLKNLKGLKSLTRNEQKSISGGLLQQVKCKWDYECEFGCYSHQGCGEQCFTCNSKPFLTP